MKLYSIFILLIFITSTHHLMAMELPLTEKILENIKIPFELPKDKTDCALITCVRYSPNGHFIAAGSKDGSIHIWDALSKKLIKTFSHHARINDIDWNSDSSRLAFASNYGIGIHDPITGTIFYAASFGKCKSVCYSPNNTQLTVRNVQHYLATLTSYYEILLIDSSTLTVQAEYIDGAHLQPLTFTDKLEKCLDKLYAYWTPENNLIMFESIKKQFGNRDFMLTCTSRPLVASLSPNNSFMAIGTEDGKIYIFDMQSKTHCFLSQGKQTSKIKAVCWNSNSSRLATVTDNGIDIWDLDTKTCLYTLQKCANASCVHWLCENYLVAGIGSTVYLWYTKDREVAEYSLRHLTSEQKQLLDELNKLWINKASAARYHTVLKKYDSTFNSLTPTVRIALKQLLPPVNSYYKNSLTFPAKVVLGLGALAGSYMLLKNSSFVAEKLLG